MADDSTQETVRDTADAAALAEAYSPARFQQRAGAFGLSAGVVGIEADQVKARKIECCEATPAHFESHVLGLHPIAGAQHKARQTGRTAGTGQASLGVCLQSDRIAGRARWTRSLRTFLGGDVVERTVLERVVGDRWHAQGPM